MTGENPVPPADVPAAPARPAQLVEHFFRHETGRLHGALVRLLGVHNLSLAEDIAQDAMLRALHHWSMGGVPANPSAWITRVAMNLAKDALRHRTMSTGKQDAIVTHVEQHLPASLASLEPGRADTEITDDTLRLLFVCCHPAIASDAQVVLALKVLCGFSTAEIARAFLTSDAAIDKQLTRTKQRLRDASVSTELPELPQELSARLNGVLGTLYLLFNEGYKATSGDQLLREDLCAEAIRLAALVVKHPTGDTPRAHALLALMLLHAARFPARQGGDGALLRLDDQDRTQWNQAMINRGLVHLAAAARGAELSEYHLLAGIAAIHCLAPDSASTDWPRILRHYDELARLKPSPIIALNRAVAVAQVYGPRAGLDALEAINARDHLEEHHLLHAVAGELHWRLGEHQSAAKSFRRALQLARVGPEQAHLARLLERASAPPASRSA